MPLTENLQAQLQNIQESPKFQQPDGGGDRQAVPFPGYTLTTPPWADDTNNQAFYTSVQTLQQQLHQQLPPGLFVPVPSESFHLTLANLIWADAYRHAAESADFHSQLCDRIAESFRHYQRTVTERGSVRLQGVGLMVLPRAVSLCLVPKDESGYERLLSLRRSIYQNPGLIALGIEQQYHFTAHITLGYFGDVSPDLDRDQLTQQLVDLNHQWQVGEPQEMWVHHAELRKFDDMTRYDRESNWPVVEL